MPTAPLVSVIIPAYNAEPYLAAAVDGALRQTHPRVEVIVVDDGSADGTAAVAGSFGGRVRCLRQANQGVSAARNAGIAVAAGDYLAFLDADDVWVEDKLEKQLRLLHSRPDLGAVGCGWTLTDPALNPTAEVVPAGALLDDLLLVRSNGGLNCSTLLARAAVVRAVGPFDTRLSTSADWDYITRIATRYPVGTVPEPLMLYRQHGSNMHRNVSRAEADMRLAMDKAFAGGLPGRAGRLRRRAYSNLYRMLAGSYWHAGQTGHAVRCGLLSLGWHPGNLFHMFRFVRARKRPRPA